MRRELRERLPDDHLGPLLVAVGVELAADLLRRAARAGRWPPDDGRPPRRAPTRIPFFWKYRASFAGGGRLALAEEPGEQDAPRLDLERPLRAEDPPDLLVDDPDEEVPDAGPAGGFSSLARLLDPLGEVEGELDVDIGLQEGPLDVADDLGEERVVDRGASGDLLQDAAQRLAEAYRAPSADPHSPRRRATEAGAAPISFDPSRLRPTAVGAARRVPRNPHIGTGRVNGLRLVVAGCHGCRRRPKPPVPPPKLNPVRVPIAEEPVASPDPGLPGGAPRLLEGGRDPGGQALHPVPPPVVRRGVPDHAGLPGVHPAGRRRATSTAPPGSRRRQPARHRASARSATTTARIPAS